MATVTLERDGSVAVFVVDNPPVNAGSLAVRRGLLDAVRRIAEDDAIDAAVIIGAGTTFIAGSDIKEFGKPLAEPRLPAVIGPKSECSGHASVHDGSRPGGIPAYGNSRGWRSRAEHRGNFMQDTRLQALKNL